MSTRMVRLTGLPLRPPLRSFLGLLAAAAVMGCGDDGFVAPGPFPDVSGSWSGQYQVTACSLVTGGDPFLCTDVFPVGASLIMDLQLDQSGSDVFGTLTQGGLAGDVGGTVDENGVVRLSGDLGQPEDSVITTILAWQTGVVGDSLLGSWRFEVEETGGLGLAIAMIDAGLKLYGPSVFKFFGCAAEDDLPLGAQVGGGLGSGDCQLAGSAFVEGLEDGAFFDVYTLTGSAGDSVEVRLESSAIDAFLLISDADEQILGGDDDSGGGPNGTDAAVEIVFDAAETVLVIATSFAPGETGPYALSVTDLGPLAPVVGSGELAVVVAGGFNHRKGLTWTSAISVTAKEVIAGRLRKPK